ncbi:MAG: peptidase domain-containing ABC transporter [Bacteroidales bacterium]|nr:peptidase domain-containing ABC transporter [Bacteroidales bacterium]
MAGFPFFKQMDIKDCGPACLLMIAKHYGRTYRLQTLRERSYIGREGVSLLGLSDAAESIGFKSLGVKIPFRKLTEEVPLPCIVHWAQRHFIVVYKTSKKFIYVSDPAYGLRKYTHDEFRKGWVSDRENGEEKGIAMLLETTPDFYNYEGEKPNKTKLSFLFSYIRPYKQLVVQVLLALLAGSLIQLIFPLLTQQIVDFGINNQDIGFIYLVLLAELFLFLGRMVVDFIRGWILLHLGTRMNISLIADFLMKLMRLPIAFFDSKVIGDLMQRINDQKRIEYFLTVSSLNILFSVLNFLIFGIVLLIYNMTIFWLFFGGSVLYVLWVQVFMNRRRELDNRKFRKNAENQSVLIQLFSSMQEIKLNNIEKQKRWEWEHVQANLFRIKVKSLALSQYQQAGATFINELKNILITVVAATSVIKGDMTLGMMLAVQYIIGQLNGPLDQMIGFFQRTQDARISLERLGEMQAMEDEEKEDENKLHELPATHHIAVNEVSFQYEGPHSPFVLENISLEIPESQVTAVVGVSGSGKTTLIKLLLGFYKPVKGEIRVGDIPLHAFHTRFWRSVCGVVMQDGFVFSDTIARNIAPGEEEIDMKKLYRAIEIANLQDILSTLPLGLNTIIGASGHGLSAGQKQRILIARAVYKDPSFLFFDEATNALDANNEKVIMNNLDAFFQGRTVVVVAHRLSTVKNAGQIIVLDGGKIMERGTHSQLITMRKYYYNLVKNQLELGM